jgi:hypothetical protein
MAAVVDEHVNAAVLDVGWEVLVVIVVRWFGVGSNDVPRVEEARDLRGERRRGG